MSGGYSGRFSLKFLCALVCAFFAFSIAVNCFESHDVRADGWATAWFNSQWDDADVGKVGISSWGFNSGDVIQVTVASGSELFFNGCEDGSVSYISSDRTIEDDNLITVQFTYTGGNVEFSVKGTNISGASVWVSNVVLIQAVAVDTPTPEPTATPVPPTNTPVPTKAPTNTPKPDPTTAPTQTQQETQATQATAEADTTTDTSADTSDATTAVTESAAQTTTATVATSASVVMATETPTVEETSILDEDGDGAADETNADGTPVVAALTATGSGGSKGGPKKSSGASWIWIVLLIIAGGLLYLRYRYLKKQEKLDGSDLAIAFIPGVPFLAEKFFGYLGPVKSMNTSAPVSEKSFNTANAMKEIKAMETSEKGIATGTRPAVQKAPVKRPADLSVNHSKTVADAKMAGTATAVKTASPAAKTSAPKTSVKNSKKEITADQFAGREEAKKILEERRAAQAARVEQIRKNAEARKAAAAKDGTANAEKKTVQQRPPVKRPASLSVNHAQAVATGAAVGTASKTADTTAKTAANTTAKTEPTATRPGSNKPVEKTEVKPIGKIGVKSEEKPAVKPEEKPVYKAVSKPAEKPVEKIVEKATAKPVEQSKPAQRPGSAAASAVSVTAVAGDKKENTTEKKEKPMEHNFTSAPQNGPVKRPKAELTPEQIAEREKAKKLLEERRAAQAARVEEIRKNAEARKALVFEQNQLAEEARKAEEARRAEEERLEREARKAEEARIAEEAAKAAELARQEEARKAEEAAKAAAIAKAKAEAIAEEARRLQERARAAELERKEAEAKKREEARRLEEARRAEELRRAEEARLEAEARAAEEAKRREEIRQAEEARIAEEIRQAQEARRIEEARKAEETRLAEAARLEAEARAAEEARKAEEARSLAEAKAAERARQEAAEAERAAAAAKAQAEAKLAEAQRAMEAAAAAREAKAEMNRKQSKTSAFFKTTMASSDNTVMPQISAISAADGYKEHLETKAENKAKADASKEKNPYNAYKGGIPTTSKVPDGAAKAAERARASSNANQLGTILAGQSNNAGRPVWSAPGSNAAPFKESNDARKERIREQQKKIAEEKARKEAEEERARNPQPSYADTAKTRKSAFFDRGYVRPENTNSESEEQSSAYDGIVRPSAIIDKERDFRNNPTAPAMGADVEGNRPPIMDPKAGAAPTALKPKPGFKPLNPNGSDN